MMGLSERLRRRIKRKKEEGAALMEFAILMPLLILLMLGIIEFGYLFAEFNDVRHGAREGARMAAVNLGDNTFLHTATCDSMDLTQSMTVQFTDSTNGAAGETAQVTVTGTPSPLSGLGLIAVFLPNQLQTNVEFKLEQNSDDWVTDGSAYSCP